MNVIPQPNVQLVIKSSLFQEYRQAFHLATGFDLHFVENDAPGASLAPFLVEMRQPVRVNGTEAGVLCLSPARAGDGVFAEFENCARQMLDDGCSAAEIRRAREQFDRLPMLSQNRRLALETMLRLFAIQLGEHAEKLFLQVSESEPPCVRKARNYILNHLSEPLALDEVSARAGVSPFHFCKVFKRATNLTFTDFVSRARVDQAKRLLLKPNARITEVAYDVGFQSLSQFNRSFRRITSVSPSEFRQKALPRTGGVHRWQAQAV